MTLVVWFDLARVPILAERHEAERRLVASLRMVSWHQLSSRIVAFLSLIALASTLSAEVPCDGELIPLRIFPPTTSGQANHPAMKLLGNLILPQRQKAFWNTYYGDVVAFIAAKMGGKSAKLNIVEIGTAYGGNAAALASEFRSATVVAVDPLLAGYDENDAHSRNLALWARENGLTNDKFSLAWAQALAHDGMLNSGCRYAMVHATSTEAAAAFAKANISFDVAFIDGLHTYAGVVSDIEYYEPLMKPGGVMIFNDYGNCVSRIPTKKTCNLSTVACILLLFGLFDASCLYS